MDYAIIARNDSDPIFQTRYGANVIYVRTSDTLDLALLERCVDMAKSACHADRVLIAPSTEALNRFLLEQREALMAVQAVIPLSDKSCYESISDKAAFTELCKVAGMLVPLEYPRLELAPLPFVAKPRQYTGTDGKAHSPVLVFDEAQRKSFMARFNPEDFYFQEYVEGDSVYLLYYLTTGGQVYRFSQENLVQQPEGKSILAARSAHHHEEAISSEYEALLRSIGFTGLVMVELRLCASGYCMIEANPRFWGPSQLFVDAGVNFFTYLLQDYGLCEPQSQVPATNEVKYLWFGGLFESLKNGGELSFIGIAPNSFYADFYEWMSHDVYKRNDSLNAFRRELI